MKRYEFHDWDLVHGSPVERTYGHSPRHVASWITTLWQCITIKWDGRDHLKATSWRLWPMSRSWSKHELAGLSFGIREHIDRPAGSMPVHRGWFWYVHLNGRHGGGDPRGRVLAEFMVGHQHDRPATDAGRASVPPRVKDLVGWLETCMDHRAHGPVFVADKGPLPGK